jgi:hypothetical protein
LSLAAIQKKHRHAIGRHESDHIWRLLLAFQISNAEQLAVLVTLGLDVALYGESRPIVTGYLEYGIRGRSRIVRCRIPIRRTVGIAVDEDEWGVLRGTPRHPPKPPQFGFGTLGMNDLSNCQWAPVQSGKWNLPH